jgi:hypothetical protein
MRRPLPVKIAIAMHILLALGAWINLSWLDQHASRATRLCFEGYVLANIIGCLGIVLHVSGARLFTLLLFMLYFGFAIYNLADVARSPGTFISFATVLWPAVVLAWVIIQFFRKSVRQYFAE